MHDRILEGYLKDFIADHSLGQLKETEAFEHFVNYSIISREHPENFDFETVAVGGNGDLAIDGIAIIVNEHLVSSKEDVDYFKSTLRRLDVRFMFIQSKTSAQFDSAEIGSFLYGVRNFFSSKLSSVANPQIRLLSELKEYIYDSSIDMDAAPVCDMYYATTGKWNEERPVLERIETDKKLLEGTKLFSQISFTPLDAEGIKSIYRELKRKVVREIVFDKHTILPKIQNIQEAYIGLLPAKEYLKLICDNEGKLQRNLFYDNVRDFQGNNPVNMEILATLGDPEQRDKFIVLNNGITVVAQAINKIGSTFRLKDFQIVNGCQTSHVLFRNQTALGMVFVPVKIVVTDDSDVINLIIKGTNRQTEVKVEAFESLNPFQKELEEFYATFGKAREPRLYYERRSKQYEGFPIKPQQIISLTAQAKSFLAMFLNDPHSTHRYYGELLRANRSRLFLSNHSPIPYYVSALTLFVFDRLVEAGRLTTFHRRLKYQILMLFRLLKQTSPLPFLDSKKGMDAYCQRLLEELSSREGALKCFLSCGELLEEVLKAGKYEIREAVRLRAFTADLISRVRIRTTTEPASVSRERGTVKWFSDLKGYGFILREKDKTDLFVHYTGINVSGYRFLNQGERVEFSVVDGKRGPQAVDVQLITQ